MDKNRFQKNATTMLTLGAMYADQAERNELSISEAQELAKQWINQLSIGEDRFSFVFNHDLIAIASGNSEWRGMNLSTLKDFKGRDLAASAYQETQTTGQSFAIYRWPPPGSAGKRELRYAYFAYFEPWDWIFAITDDARQVSDQFDKRRKEMEHAIGESLASLTLAQSGFAFIASDEGALVSPLPASHAGLLGEIDEKNGKSLRELLDRIPATGEVASFRFTPRDTDASWQISSAYFKPLGWTIVAAVPSEDLTRAATELRNRLGILFLAVLLVSLAVAWALSVRITRPLQELSDFARALPEQDLSAAGPIPPHIARLPQNQPDEVGRLAATFMLMDKELREKVARLVQETSSRERFESELNIAHSIQMGLLPIPLPASVLKRIDLYATMIPAKEVGGDLYDYFILPDGRLCFAIGDVSDKGVPAALFMAVTRTLIRASAEDETAPALLMERVNNRLSENNPNLMFVTLILAVLDLASGELAWANAGHPPPCVLGANGKLRLLEGRSGPACGVLEGASYRQFSTRLEPGETVFGYTDGVTEALDPDGHLYGEPRLFTLLADSGSDTARNTANTLLDDVRAFAKGTEQSDDITLIAAKRPAP
ncbi:SpoIIE family protein phosphatase [Pollutimonas sp. H1-120]|uniref:SpoIIE family protein phosphatase n=1 Tax=Pollutimonas sp. H1-120 TaxID=3148824 RepID=UPI003B519BBA